MLARHIERTARMIADRLFVTGLGKKAVRLKLVSRDGRDLGGWCKQAVIDQIVAVLSEQKVTQ